MNNYAWVEPEVAAAAARAKDATAEALLTGHGLLDREEFVRLLSTGEIEIIIFRNQCAALVTWGQSAEGKLLNILTSSGEINACAVALDYLEQAAKDSGAKVIASVGHPGWARIMKQKGYDLKPRLFMRKVLQ